LGWGVAAAWLSSSSALGGACCSIATASSASRARSRPFSVKRSCVFASRRSSAIDLLDLLVDRLLVLEQLRRSGFVWSPPPAAPCRPACQVFC
jgi:hypothetical protein